MDLCYHGTVSLYIYTYLWHAYGTQITQINVNVYHYMSVHHCIWVFARALYEHVKLSCVAESATPLHVACGVGAAGVWGACSGSCWHSFTAAVCGRLELHL